MTESEARELLQAKLTCMEKENKPICSEEGCDRNCDGCNYCYAQGTIGEQKQALAMAIKALGDMAKLKEMGECYIIPKSSTWEINGIDVHKALEKQIPKKVNKAIDTTWGVKKEVPVCPVCDYYLTEVHWIVDDGATESGKVTYCDTCGQAIDWE